MNFFLSAPVATDCDLSQVYLGHDHPQSTSASWSGAVAVDTNERRMLAFHVGCNVIATLLENMPICSAPKLVSSSHLNVSSEEVASICPVPMVCEQQPLSTPSLSKQGSSVQTSLFEPDSSCGSLVLFRDIEESPRRNLVRVTREDHRAAMRTLGMPYSLHEHSVRADAIATGNLVCSVLLDLSQQEHVAPTPTDLYQLTVDFRRACAETGVPFQEPHPAALFEFYNTTRPPVAVICANQTTTLLKDLSNFQLENSLSTFDSRCQSRLSHVELLQVYDDAGVSSPLHIFAVEPKLAAIHVTDAPLTQAHRQLALQQIEQTAARGVTLASIRNARDSFTRIQSGSTVNGFRRASLTRATSVLTDGLHICAARHFSNCAPNCHLTHCFGCDQAPFLTGAYKHYYPCSTNQTCDATCLKLNARSLADELCFTCKAPIIGNFTFCPEHLLKECYACGLLQGKPLFDDIDLLSLRDLALAACQYHAGLCGLDCPLTTGHTSLTTRCGRCKGICPPGLNTFCTTHLQTYCIACVSLQPVLTLVPFLQPVMDNVTFIVLPAVKPAKRGERSCRSPVIGGTCPHDLFQIVGSGICLTCTKRTRPIILSDSCDDNCSLLVTNAPCDYCHKHIGCTWRCSEHRINICSYCWTSTALGHSYSKTEFVLPETRAQIWPILAEQHRDACTRNCTLADVTSGDDPSEEGSCHFCLGRTAFLCDVHDVWKCLRCAPGASFTVREPTQGHIRSCCSIEPCYANERCTCGLRQSAYHCLTHDEQVCFSCASVGFVSPGRAHLAIPMNNCLHPCMYCLNKATHTSYPGGFLYCTECIPPLYTVYTPQNLLILNS